ncbi:NUDIX hydrolase [Micromonospora wenchangensis]|uniref:NUDIX hydrolase n=1 Tax=Micromonospora humida TaxID=2809018 RepID=UPI00367070F5
MSVTLPFRWIADQPAPTATVVQVYGWLFDDHGRVLVQDTPDGHNLPGGSPELVDADPAATLHREAAEESQVRLTDPVLLGHELAGDHAYLRMAARIVGYDARRPDPDGGRLLGRRLVPVADVPLLLGWGDSGAEQAAAAAQVAATRWALPVGSPTAPAAVID